MSGATERLLQLGGKVEQRDRPTPPPPVAPVPPQSDDDVRQTVDLSGPEHRRLIRWKLETALRLEVHPSNCSTQAVLEEVIGALLDERDETVARAVRRRLEQRIVARATRGGGRS